MEPLRKKMRHAVYDGPDIGSKPLRVMVGASRQNFYVHENLLYSNSDFFDNARRGASRGIADGNFELPQTEPDIFDIWIKWVYTGRMFLVEQDQNESEGADWKEFERVKDCYIFGEFLQDTNFKDACIDTLIEGMQVMNRVPQTMFWWIYAHSTAASGHRRFAVRTFVHCINRATWTAAASGSKEFYEDVLEYIGVVLLADGARIQRPNQFFKAGDTCFYHDHAWDGLCYKDKFGTRS